MFLRIDKLQVELPMAEEPDAGLWAQAVAFANDLGLDRVAAAAGFGGSN